MKRCPDRWLGLRCSREAGHEGLHTVGGRSWFFGAPDDSAWVAERLAKVIGRVMAL